MLEIDPYFFTSQENHIINFWVREKCYRYYVKMRRENCTFMEILDLWLKAPYCFDCAVSDPFWRDKLPDITQKTWEENMEIILGSEFLDEVEKVLKTENDYYLTCKKCKKELRPWDDDIYIVTYHLEEHYNIPLEEPDKTNPSKKLRKQITNLYNNKCFRCNTSDKKLHIDHILPRCKGGTGAFRNLQTLCEECGNLKGDRIPVEVTFNSLMYFTRYSSDSYEGLFW
jgi:5-methylcytosine-specific restriction endonuclease McrA